MLDRTLNVAPMMGCTDRHCRYLLRLLSPNALLYSEMIVSGALIHGDANHFLAHQLDTPVAVQLGGSNPAELAQCAKLSEAAGYQEVNLNVGCPSDRVQSGGIGACLMAEADLVARCFVAMQSAVSIPITIKCRIGIDDEDSYESFYQFVDTLHRAGCRIFIVHARKAILTGLSPKENREIPPLKYDYVYRIKDEFQDSIFILNGGIKSLGQASAEMEKVSGIMLGRAIYSNPWLLAELESNLFSTPLPDPMSIINQYRQYVVEQNLSGTHIKYMLKHLLGFFTGVPGARAFRRHLSEKMSKVDANIDVLDEAVDKVTIEAGYTISG